MESRKEPVVSPLISLLGGLVLLLPAAYFCLTTYILPTINTFAMSQTKYNLLSPAQYIGMENFSKLAEDSRFSQAMSYSVLLGVTRVAIVAIVPLLVGVLMGVQGKIGRSINRILFSLLIFVIAPVALTALWSVYWGQLWGKQPSPIGPPPDWLFIGSLNGSRNSIIVLDSMITLVIALVVGGSAFMAVMRGRRNGSWPWQAMIGVWLIGLFLAFGSGLLSFTLPYILTNGGPGNATATLVLVNFQVAFQRFDFGYASAQSVFLIMGGLFVGLLVWTLLVVFRLRISTKTSDDVPAQRNYLLVATIPLILLIAYPLIALFLWGNGLVQSNGGSSALLEGINTGQATNNSMAALSTIWLIQLPITYLAGLALGFLRPLGRIGSNALFLIFLVFLFVPSEALQNAWYVQAKDAGIINTLAGVALPWTISAAALIVFKLFFDGAYERYAAARQSNESQASSVSLRNVFLMSIPVVLLVGLVLSFASTQAIMWPLIVTNAQDLFSLPLLIAFQRGQAAGNNLPVVGLSVLLIQAGALFAVALAVLQVLFVDRLAILGGKSDQSESMRTPASSPVIS